MNQQALLLINSHARQGQQRTEAIEQLQKLGLKLIEESTDDSRQLPDIIRRYQEQVDLVIVGGGDGTLNAAVNGLVDTQLPLGILPLGTANDLARTLGISTCLTEACKIIATGQVRQIDLGCVNGKYFFNVASLGLSVQITRKLSQAAKRRWGVFAYAATATQEIWQARPFRAEIRSNGKSISSRTIQITVGNGRYYGGGIAIADNAEIDDQKLNVYSLEVRHWWQILALLPALQQGEQAKLPGVRAFDSQEVEVYTHTPRAINTDGEIATYTPAKFRIVPNALSVLVAPSN